MILYPKPQGNQKVNSLFCLNFQNLGFIKNYVGYANISQSLGEFRVNICN